MFIYNPNSREYGYQITSNPELPIRLEVLNESNKNDLLKINDAQALKKHFNELL
jgi:hypothetical protein